MIFRLMTVASVLGSVLAEAERDREYLKSLPEEEANRIHAERKKKWEAEEEHRKKLEIAEAGRARNFWGQ